MPGKSGLSIKIIIVSKSAYDDRDYHQSLTHITVVVTSHHHASVLWTDSIVSLACYWAFQHHFSHCVQTYQLPSSFRQPHSVHCPPGLPHPAHITSSQSPPSLSPSVTPSTFHSELKTTDIYINNWIVLRPMAVRQRFHHCWCTRLPNYYAYLLLIIIDTMLRCIELFK